MTDTGIVPDLSGHDARDLNTLAGMIEDDLGYVPAIQKYGLCAAIDTWARTRYAAGGPAPENGAQRRTEDGTGVEDGSEQPSWPVRLRHAPKQARSRTKYNRLRAVAIDLYNEPSIGRDRITTAMVAQGAGVAIGTLYRFWNDRVDMLDDIAPDRERRSLPTPV